MEAPELDTPVEHSFFAAVQSRAWIPRAVRGLGGTVPGTERWRCPAPRPRSLPQARERGPVGRSLLKPVESPRPATSRHAGGPSRLRAAIWGCSPGSLSSARQAQLGKAGGSTQGPPCPSPSSLGSLPLAPAQRGRGRSRGRRVRQPHLSQRWRLLP